jgi:pyruvate-formate lyase-activating enzyme
MVLLVHALSGGCSKGVQVLASECKISRQRTEDALIDLKNAGVVEVALQKKGATDEEKARRAYSISKTFDKADRLLSLDESRDLVEKYVASRKDIIDVHVEAAKPKHVAISYDGEPTMYAGLPELIQEFRSRGISTFVVTNGTFPERILAMKEKGNLPTQLYVTLAAPDRDTYLKVCSSVKPYFPVHEDHWERLTHTLGLLQTLGCRTVIRITSVRHVNMIRPELYREKVAKANPSFLEVKGFSISGNAPRISERLGDTDFGYKEEDAALYKTAFRYAPTHDEILDFARAISNDFKTFPLVSESRLNRQVLMAVGWQDASDIKIDFESGL